ncbi:hypothetical protein QEP66_14915 [Streptomyces sp. LB8]|uniref:hypothetical protein n=1 Tax=Streptomyces sp. LB8 TaxID=3042509 RepID=UPI00264742AA|nr:hypothetical protein [Streptomyces sp. LB8]MDN5383362.1 hypothetical protein [Streptomyces sp. LB8]
MTQTTTETAARTTTRLLHGYGRLTWPQARALLSGCACTWTDFDGIHLQDTPPDELPVAATHLWAWNRTGDRLVRLRFDTPGILYAAVLTPADADAVPDTAGVPPARGFPEEVTVTERRTVLRDPQERSAAALPPEFTERTWHLVEVPGESPLTFVRADPDS